MRGILAKFGLVLASFLLVFGLLEGWLRIRETLHPPSQGQDNVYIFEEYDPELGWRNRPGASGLLRTPNGHSNVNISKEGFRTDRLYGEPTGKPRMLVLGDSFAWGYGVESQERFSEQVEDMSGGMWEVINAGVYGYSTTQEILLFRRLAPKYRPDLTVVVFGLDDLMENLLTQNSGYPMPRFVLRNGRLKLTNVPVPRRARPWEEAVKHELSVLDQETWMGRLDSTFRNWLRLYPYVLKRLKLASYIIDARMHAPEAVALSESIFKTFSDEAEEAGSRLVVLMKPFGETVETGDQLDLYRHMRRRLDALGVAVVDPLEALRVRNAENSIYFPSDRHWNPEGHKVVAQVVFEAVLTNEWLRLPSQPVIQENLP